MVHPYEDNDHVRHSPADIMKMMQEHEQYSCCPTCRKTDNFVTESESVESYPSGSTATIKKCLSCGCRWEVAYSIVYSMCVLAKTPPSSDTPASR